MKTLYLLRHAKSSWNYPELEDFERPLNKRGRTDLPLMGKVLKQLKVKPDLILASPATRAAMTAKIISEYLNMDERKLKFDTSIYEADPTSLLQLLRRMPKEIDSLILIGHNPALTSLANILANHQVSNIPTAGCYAINFNISDWSKINEKMGHFTFFEFPKKYYNE